MYPAFDLGVEYEELRGGNYRFKLLKPMTIQVPQLQWYDSIVSFRDIDDNEWGSIEYDFITANEGYAWNGASPKVWVPLIGWVGTPDPVATRMATLFHDLLFQFFTTEHFPLSLKQSNEIFFDIMEYHNFKYANTYFGAVQDFSERYAKSPPTNGEHSVLLKP